MTQSFKMPSTTSKVSVSTLKIKVIQLTMSVSTSRNLKMVLMSSPSAPYSTLSSLTSDKAAKVKPVPAKVSQQLHAFTDEPSFDLDFNYRSAVGKLNYLA